MKNMRTLMETVCGNQVDETMLHNHHPAIRNENSYIGDIKIKPRVEDGYKNASSDKDKVCEFLSKNGYDLSTYELSRNLNDYTFTLYGKEGSKSPIYMDVLQFLDGNKFKYVDYIKNEDKVSEDTIAEYVRDCPDCGGSGEYYDDETGSIQICPSCSGDGEYFGDETGTMKVCPDCTGDGEYFDDETGTMKVCPSCSGSGEYDSYGEELLDEDFGNLEQFKDGFMQNLKYMFDNNNKVGQNSEIETITMKKIKPSITLFDDDKSVHAMIITGYNNKTGEEDNLLFVTKTSSTRYGSNDNFSWDTSDKITWDMMRGYNKLDTTYGKTSTFLAYMYEFIKMLKNNVYSDFTCYLVKSDKERTEKVDDRRKAKQGREIKPSSAGYQNYINTLRTGFNNRLEMYKNNKSPSVSTPEEALNLIINSGYIDTFRIGGYVYKRDTQSIRIESLLANDNGLVKSNYIQYKNESFNYKDDNENQPPRYIKIILGIDKNNPSIIKPLDIEFEGVKMKNNSFGLTNQ